MSSGAPSSGVPSSGALSSGEVTGVNEPGAASREEEVIPLVEEVARVTKRRVVTGRVRVSTVTDTFDEAVAAELSREAVTVTRVPVDREVTVLPAIRTEGDVTIIPVLEEILVVEKRLVLKEEIHLTRVKHTDTFASHVTLRRQRAVVDHQAAGGPDQDPAGGLHEEPAGGLHEGPAGGPDPHPTAADPTRKDIP